MSDNNITARELSLSLGYNEGYISRILKGKIDPSFKSMMDTMLYFDISPLNSLRLIYKVILNIKVFLKLEKLFLRI